MLFYGQHKPYTVLSTGLLQCGWLGSPKFLLYCHLRVLGFSLRFSVPAQNFSLLPRSNSSWWGSYRLCWSVCQSSRVPCFSHFLCGLSWIFTRASVWEAIVRLCTLLCTLCVLYSVHFLLTISFTYHPFLTQVFLFNLLGNNVISRWKM